MNFPFNRIPFNLIRELTVAEFKLRDQGSIIGFFWTLLHPLLFFIVLYALFSKWTGRSIDNFALYLLIGIVQWNFFAAGTYNALTAIVRRKELIKNIDFPKEILVISAVGTILLSHLLELAILLIILFFLGPGLSLTFLLLPIITFVQVVLILCISFPLSGVFVYYRDISRIWDILLRVGFFITPIFYSLSAISEKRRIFLLLNPMTHLINSARDCLLYNKMPNLFNLAIILSAAFLALIFGYLLFKKIEIKFAEVL